MRPFSVRRNAHNVHMHKSAKMFFLASKTIIIIIKDYVTCILFHVCIIILVKLHLHACKYATNRNPNFTVLETLWLSLKIFVMHFYYKKWCILLSTINKICPLKSIQQVR